MQYILISHCSYILMSLIVCKNFFLALFVKYGWIPFFKVVLMLAKIFFHCFCLLILSLVSLASPRNCTFLKGEQVVGLPLIALLINLGDLGLFLLGDKSISLADF